MAKIAFSKLGLTKNTDVVSIDWNGQTVEIRQYLPFQEKLEIIQAVLNNCQDENNFINEAKLEFYLDLEVVYHYTNITFTDKQKEDLAKLYDLLRNKDFLNTIINNIPSGEYGEVRYWTFKTARNIYDYRNSIYGILDAVSNDYQNLELDAEKIKKDIADPENLKVVKDVLTKLG